ncbi:alpha/beta hydrolase [Actinomadura rudentiformis]|uniref:Alpha/beta hydrolase n=2 Tax=Actinomadura rudentiformis TaxID=359158 RepID=A0A6H9YK56_9ACTN|nr:alpha/beta hydrolase [Actinomadura rudentiformis]
MKYAVRPIFRYSPLTPSMLRLAAVLDLGAPLLMRPSRETEIERVWLDGFHGEWIRPAGGTGSHRVILYLHGGGFFCCGLRTHRTLVERIAKRSDATAFSVAYRQLPRAPLSTSMADALASYRWLLDQGHAPENIVISGDSAGAFLAFTTALNAIKGDLPAPAGIAALSPLVDLDHEARSTYAHTRTDIYIPVHRLKSLKRLLLAGMEGDPLPSPCDQALQDLPPVLIIVGSCEGLRWDAELMAERLTEADVPHRLQIWENQIHVFPAFAGVIPEGQEAINEVAAFIRETTTPEHAAA